MKIFNDKHTTNETGLTLIEILVSITIISIVIIVVSFVLLQINQTNQLAVVISEATYIAQTEIEKNYNFRS